MGSRIVEKISAVVCALCLAGGVMSGIVFAKADEAPAEEPAARETFFITESPWDGEEGSPADAEGEPEAQMTSEPLAVQSGEVVDNRSVIPCEINGTAWGDCPVTAGMPWIGVESLCRALGLSVYGSFQNGVYTLEGDISFETSEGSIYFVFNGRYILLEQGVLFRDGQAYLPVELLARCLGIRAWWDAAAWRVYIQADAVTPLESGSTWYDETDVYWLSRVIYAEAGDESLLCQIGIGSVVMNRLGEQAQDSVYDVIFAKNQFEVVINGMIYMEPDETARIAAKLALEGYDVTEGADCFDTAERGAGYETLLWIGDHCFMRQT